MKQQIYEVNNFKKNEIPAQISCDFCEISPNTIFKQPFGRLLQHKHSFCLLSHHDLLFFQKRCHIYFPVECFLGLIYRLPTRVISIFQTLNQPTISNSVKHLRQSFFPKIVNSLTPLSVFTKNLPCRCSTRFQKHLCKQPLKDVVK